MQLFLCRQRKAAADASADVSAATLEDGVVDMEIDEGTFLPVDADMHGWAGEQQTAAGVQKTGKHGKHQKGSSRRARKPWA